MKQCGFAYVLSVFLLLTGTQALADEKAEAILADIKKTAPTIKSLRADVAITNENGGVKQTATGKVRLKRPNLFHLAVGEPFRSVIASDGKKTYLVVEERKRGLIGELNANIAGTEIPSFLATFLFRADPRRTLNALRDRSVPFAYRGTEIMDGVTYRILDYQFSPLTDIQIKYSLYVSPQHIVVGWKNETTSPQGKTSGFEFWKNVKLDEEMPDAAFAYMPPKDIVFEDFPRTDAKLLAVGAEAPAFEMIDTKTKEKFSLTKALKGRKAVLITFWLCDGFLSQEELPRFQKVYERHQANGLGVIAVNGLDEPETITKYLAKEKFTLQVGMALRNADGVYDLLEKYGVLTYPTSYLIGADGKILWRGVRFEEAELLQALEKAGIK